MSSGGDFSSSSLASQILQRNTTFLIFVRLYEAVIVRSGNSLSYKQAVVTGHDVYLTETPPRTLTHLLHASHITDVSLVHDLPEFLRGGVRDQTTHILVRYRPSRSTSLVKLKLSPPSHSQPSPSCIDEESEEEDAFEEATHALAKAAHDTASVCSDPLSSLHTPRDSLDGRRKSFSLSREPLLSSRSSSHLLLPPNHDQVSSLSCAKSPPDHIYSNDSHSSMIADVLSRVGQQITRSTTPDALPRTKMSRSLSALETYHRSSPLALELPTRSKSVLDKPSTGHQPRRSQSLNLRDMTDGNGDEKEVHLYTLSTSTLLFHLLHSLWVSSSLISTAKPEEVRPVFPEISSEHGLEHAFGQIQAQLMTSSTLEHRFSILQELQEGVRKFSTVKRLVWRDSDTLKIMGKFIKRYMKMTSASHRTQGTEEQLQKRQDELELLIMTLETVALCLQGTQQCPSKIKVMRENKFECLCTLITETIKAPEVPGTYKLTCERWLTDFRELSSRAWENLPESELLKLVQEVLHASVCALYELMNCVTELSWACGVQPSTHENIPSLTTFLQHVPVENWLFYSVPQMLALLQPDSSGAASGYDAALIHQYCTVLANLIHHNPRALQYCITTYAEELRYYVQESVVSSRLRENCPIKPHTLKVVHLIAQLMRSKNALRNR
ncbi:hypothetical protein O3P69_003463 [Scylla paramamosain]|uniref:Uncharacterized protein n=1 Tax=Scylla paramamosain TaxID=85552 RepID=A0AAW0UHQ9_SCYPA